MTNLYFEVTFNGKDIETMSRDELLEALKQVSELYKVATAQQFQIAKILRPFVEKMYEEELKNDRILQI